MTITAVSFSFIFFSKEKWADFVVLLSPLVLFSVNLNTYVLQSYKCINDIFIVTPPHPFLVLWLYVNVSQIETWRDDPNALPTGFYTEETQPATAKTYFSFWSGVKKKKKIKRHRLSSVLYSHPVYFRGTGVLCFFFYSCETFVCLKQGVIRKLTLLFFPSPVKRKWKSCSTSFEVWRV